MIGYDGIGLIIVGTVDGVVRVEWSVADASGPGANARRAWIGDAIRAIVGHDAICIDAGRVSRTRGVA